MEKPIRVLQHMRVLDSGGIEAFVFANYRKINKKKVVFDFLVTRDQKEFYDDEIKKLGGKKIILKYKKFKNPLLNPLSQSISFYKFCKKNRDTYKIIEFQSIGANGFFDILAAKCAGIKCRIAHSHISNDIKPASKSNSNKPGIFRAIFVKFRQQIIKFFVTKCSTHYFGCSKMACEWMFLKSINDKGISKVINNPINVEKFVFNEEMRRENRIKYNVDEKIVIGHVGRFVFSKNHEFLLKVFSEILKINKNFVLMLVGTGPLKSKILKLAEELQVIDNIIFCGETTKVNELYNCFDIFTFPSYYEGLGIVLIEAQTNGLPILASDTIPKEVKITDNFIFKSLKIDIKDWAEEIIRISQNKRNLNNYKKIIEAGYSIDDVSIFLENTYLNLYDL